ncbi:unnamed protein product [Sphagnum balticum]
MAVGGAVTGTAQIGRGIYNTPTAISASRRARSGRQPQGLGDIRPEGRGHGNTRDDRGDFVKGLVGEYARTMGKSAPEGKISEQLFQGRDRQVKDLEFYDLLGVKPNAMRPRSISSTTSRRSRTIRTVTATTPTHSAGSSALGRPTKYSPTRNCARVMMRAVGRGVEHAPKMESGALYAMIFGSEKFEPYIGELKLASQMQAADTESDLESHPKVKAFRQRKREV